MGRTHHHPPGLGALTAAGALSHYAALMDTGGSRNFRGTEAPGYRGCCSHPRHLVLASPATRWEAPAAIAAAVSVIAAQAPFRPSP